MSNSKKEEQTAQWVEAYNNGASFSQIGREAGVAPSTVRRRIGDLVEMRPKKPYQHLLNKWIELYSEQGWSAPQIADHYNVDTVTVVKYLKGAGVEIRYKGTKESPFEKAVTAWTVAYLHGASLREIADAYNTFPQTVHKWIQEKIELRTYEESTRTYSFERPDYFSSIDSHEKAYWLGVWFGTGFTFLEASSYECTLVLTEKDRETLERFKQVIGYGGEILKDERSLRLRLNQKQLASDLVRLGLVRNKNDEMTLSEEVLPYINSFLVGYYEGKGYGTRRTLQLFGNKQMMDTLGKMIFDAVGVEGRVNERHSEIEGRAVDFYEWSCTYGADVERLAKWMYKDLNDYNKDRCLLDIIAKGEQQ